MIKRRRKVGLVFGGGGARGFAHIGVIKALEENGVSFDHVAGCSAGSVTAAMYCSGMSYFEMFQAMKNLKKEDFLTSKLFFVPSDPRQVENTMHHILGGARDGFGNTKVPLCIHAVDIVKGEEFVFQKGSISKAVSASCAVPGLYSPVIEGGMMLMDGGLMNNIPASVLRERGCDAIVSVNVGDLSTPIARSSGMIDVLFASLKILIRSNSMKGIKDSDVVVRPEVSKFKFDSIENFDKIVAEGYRAAMEMMPQILGLFR